MSRKLPFSVLARSGWEDGYSGSDISVHTPLMKGWRSQRFCTYPQELVLQLGGLFHVQQLQLLSHEYLITGQIELLVGGRRLGHISLSSNEKSSFRQRELKSIHLDIICSEIKLLLHHNHINQLNLFNQVGLVAINIIGDDLTNTREEDNNHSHMRSDQVPKFIDLSFAINQDPSVAALILRLEQSKQNAVQRERYKLAKQLKECIEELQQVGQELTSYEVQKREAVLHEDYDLAEEKRSQGEVYRQQSFKRLNLSALLIESDKMDDNPPLTLHPVRLQDIHEELQPVRTHHKEVQPIKTHDTTALPNISTHEICYHANQDDRPLPALNKSSSRTATPPRTATSSSLHELEALSKKATQEAVPVTKVFGMHTVQLLYSKHFQHRSEGLDNISSELQLQTSSTPLLLQAITLVLRKLLRDKVYQVFSRCVDLLLEVCCTLAEKLKLSKHDLSLLVEKVGYVLLHRLGDSTTRIRQMASKALQELAKLPLIKKWQLTDSILLQPSTAQSPWRQLLGQIKILHDECCNANSKIDLPLTTTFLGQCMDHTQQPVRTAAGDSLLELYKHHGNNIRQMLSTYEEQKSSIAWKRLFDNFDRIDGKPSVADVLKEQDSQEELQQLRQERKRLKALVRSHELPHAINRCLFCGVGQSGAMEEHYLNCAMLTYCGHCKQMVEVSGLTDHLLGECEVHDQFYKCRRCGEAVHNSNHGDHQSCPLLEEDKQCCPFCHSLITKSEQSWKDHLMATDGCRKSNQKSAKQSRTHSTHT